MHLRLHARSAVLLATLTGAAAFGLGVTLLQIPARAQTDAKTAASALGLRIVRDTGTVEATCVLVNKAERPNSVVLTFVTAGHLFKSADGTPLPAARSIEIIAGGSILPVNLNDVEFPAGTAVDIAVVRAVVPRTSLVAAPISYDPPSMNGVFLLAGRRADGTPATLAQRIARRASASVYGDRDGSSLSGCAGTPAVGERGVFGIVTECPAGRPPLIVPFSAARAWLEPRLPGPPTPAAAQFVVAPRQFAGPEILAACGEDKSGEIDVPLNLLAGETAVDASATVMTRKALRLADVKVLTLTNSVVKLRFTLGGEPPPRPPAPCPPGQALFTVHVTVVKTPGN